MTIVQIHDPNFLTSKVKNPDPKKSMKPRTAVILGFANTKNFALNPKSRKNNFQNPPIRWLIHPLLDVL